MGSTFYPAPSSGGSPSAPAATAAASSTGYIGMPQNSKSASYTLVASDAGKHIYVTVTGQTITIPANSPSSDTEH